MSALWWVRHGPTHARGFTGWRDLPADLSDRAALARLDAALPVAAPVVSSDLARAVATADALAATRPRLPHEPRLRELHFGSWEGRSFAAIEAEDPALLRAFLEQPGEVSPPGGESWNALEARVSAAADSLAARHDGGVLIVVAHHAVILTQLRRALGCSPARILGQRIDCLSISVTEYRNGRWTAGRINHHP